MVSGTFFLLTMVLWFLICISDYLKVFLLGAPVQKLDCRTMKLSWVTSATLNTGAGMSRMEAFRKDVEYV